MTCFHSVQAQTENDSTKLAPPMEKSPSGAMLRSVLIPGWGQWYSDQKLKAVIVFGIELALIGNAVYYHQLAVKSQTSEDQIFYEDYRSRFTWYTVGFHLLNILDAFVDAHLWSFDAGPDLSIGGSQRGEPGVMVSLCWSF
jgi:hypothetical protein